MKQMCIALKPIKEFGGARIASKWAMRAFYAPSPICNRIKKGLPDNPATLSPHATHCRTGLFRSEISRRRGNFKCPHTLLRHEHFNAIARSVGKHPRMRYKRIDRIRLAGIEQCILLWHPIKTNPRHTARFIGSVDEGHIHRHIRISGNFIPEPVTCSMSRVVCSARARRCRSRSCT